MLKLSNKIFIAGVLLLLISVGAFIIHRSITGLLIYEQVTKSNYTLEDYGKDIRELESQLLVSNVNLSACLGFKEKFFVEFSTLSREISDCKVELGVLKANFDLLTEQHKKETEEFERDLNETNQAIADLEAEKQADLEELRNETSSELKELQEDYDSLAQNTANNLCCKAKIDNPDISFYKIENNKITCLEEGELSISCS